MQIICLEEEAFYSLLEKVMGWAAEHTRNDDKWISTDEAMRKLRITSKTTLQKLRDEGKIRFSQPEKKIILYDSFSIDEYLEKNVRNTF